MKRIKIVDIIFTALNVLVFAAVFVMIGYVYTHANLGYHLTPLDGFTFAVFFVPVFVLINGIWMPVRNKLYQYRPYVSDPTRSDDHKRICLNRLNKIFIFLNILLFAVIIIRIIISFLREGWSDFFSMLFFDHSVFFELINVSWIVVYVHTEDHFEEKRQI